MYFYCMISFDKKGNLKPFGAIQISVDEFEDYFVRDFISSTRAANFEKYVRYSRDLKKITGGKPLKQWINGSFVTKKTNPKDIDLVTFLDHGHFVKLGTKLNIFKPRLSWEHYGVDAYLVEVFPASSKHAKYTAHDKAEWLDLFTTSRPNRQGERFGKGFLEIFY